MVKYVLASPIRRKGNLISNVEWFHADATFLSAVFIVVKFFVGNVIYFSVVFTFLGISRNAALVAGVVRKRFCF
jgi:hypothetical protein